MFCGSLNAAGRSAHGVQFGGVGNLAGADLRGVQIGVVDVAGEHGGVPIGLVGYVSDVGLRYDVWGDEGGMVAAALRSGNCRVANYGGWVTDCRPPSNPSKGLTQNSE